MGAIEESFSELANTIQKQRINDSALDEICKDFELLTADLRKLPEKQSEYNCQIHTDLRNSLDGLKQEILTKVRRP